MAIQYTSEEKKYVLLKGNILKRMEAERVSDAQMARKIWINRQSQHRGIFFRQTYIMDVMRMLYQIR